VAVGVSVIIGMFTSHEPQGRECWIMDRGRVAALTFFAGVPEEELDAIARVATERLETVPYYDGVLTGEHDALVR
jgi:hypothetical protein